MFGVRTLINPADPQDLTKIAALQDAIVARQDGGPGQFQVPNWDEASRAQIRKALLALGSTLEDSRGMFGKREDVDPVRHLIGSAMAWGGNPEKDAYYQVVTPQLNDGKTPYQLDVSNVPAGRSGPSAFTTRRGNFRRMPRKPTH